jgi:phosphate:Na+ symporter
VILAASDIDAGRLLMGVLGGLALFLFGLNQMAAALKTVAGGSMRILLARLTTNRVKAAFTGAFVTAALQSSSVTTVLVVGFISAGLMTLAQSVGVIMGANIGSTLTAQLIAFKVTDLALLMIAVGFAVQSLLKRERPRLYGSALFGLGLLFLGMKLMGEATGDLQDHPGFKDLMARMDNPLLGILVATVFTAVVQSSAATTGIAIVLAGSGLVTIEAGIALALGANIGTCATALLASIGKPREAVQAAVAHVLFNVAGVAVWIGLVPVLARFVQDLSPGDVPRQIANAHTAFNVANTLLFLPFTVPFARVVRFLVPSKPAPEPEGPKPRYLDPSFLTSPELALRAARLEIVRVGEQAAEMVRQALPATLSGSGADLDELDRREQDEEALYAATLDYLGRLSRKGLTRAQTTTLNLYIAVLNHFQNVGANVETNFVAVGRERLERDLTVSEETAGMLEPLFETVRAALGNALHAFAYDDREEASKVVGMKDLVNEQSARAKAHLLRRLTADAPNRQWTFRVESDIVENLKRLYYFTKRIAKAVLGEFEAGSETESAKRR